MHFPKEFFKEIPEEFEKESSKEMPKNVDGISKEI